jgi:hypothetical protein
MAFPLEVISGVGLGDFNTSTGLPQIGPSWIRDVAGDGVEAAASHWAGPIVPSGRASPADWARAAPFHPRSWRQALFRDVFEPRKRGGRHVVRCAVPSAGRENGNAAPTTALGLAHLADPGAIRTAVADLNQERMADPLAGPRISPWAIPAAWKQWEIPSGTAAAPAAVTTSSMTVHAGRCA